MKCKPGQPCDEDPDNWAPVKHLPATGGADQLFMRDVFYAASPANGYGVHGPGLDMDAESDACPRKCNGKKLTYRNMGVLLHASIQYDNTGTIIAGSSYDDIKYQIKLFTKPSTIFHVEVVQRGAGETHARTIHHLFGPRIMFDAEGKLGGLQWNHVVVQLTTSLAMFAVATTVVDLLMLYVLPNRHEYYGIKYETVGHGDEFGPLEGAYSTGAEAGEGTLPPGIYRTAAYSVVDPELPPGMQPNSPEQAPLLGAVHGGQDNSRAAHAL